MKLELKGGFGKMRLKSVEIQNPPILVTIAGDRYFRLEKELVILVTTDSATIEYRVKPGFVTDFRSGGPVVDLFIKQFGTNLMQAAYICHDIAYTPMFTENGCRSHQIEKGFADALLEQMLVYAHVKKWKARVVKYALRFFGKKAYMKDNAFSVENSKRYSICFHE